ncbi:hypothetical protein SNEBB_001418 [Seison nebaliae]|nr:hypothetical protein SNEBB_001418 [Seison nebaliae]
MYPFIYLIFLLFQHTNQVKLINNLLSQTRYLTELYENIDRSLTDYETRSNFFNLTTSVDHTCFSFGKAINENVTTYRIIDNQTNYYVENMELNKKKLILNRNEYLLIFPRIQLNKSISECDSMNISHENITSYYGNRRVLITNFTTFIFLNHSTNITTDNFNSIDQFENYEINFIINGTNERVNESLLMRIENINQETEKTINYQIRNQSTILKLSTLFPSFHFTVLGKNDVGNMSNDYLEISIKKLRKKKLKDQFLVGMATKNFFNNYNLFLSFGLIRYFT